MTAQRVLATVIALLLAVAVVRNSAVAALADRDPDSAARLWAGHPAVEISRGMTDIARAARVGRPVDAATIALIDDGALKSPLAAEPFLVRGIQAQLAGSARLAEQAFAAAQSRDPRSLPAHYFLANLYLSEGNGERGLEQLAAVARLSPNGLENVAPYLAAFARNRANWGQLRSAFRVHPEIERVALIQIAADPASADAVLALSGKRRSSAAAPWIPVLLNSLVADGQYARARAIWASAAGLPQGAQPLLFDAGFSEKVAPPPFNWALTSSTVGLAERQRGGRLHAIFYGNEDGVLARQLLVLAPGAYRLSARIAGGAAQIAPISWTVRCATAAAMPPLSAPVSLAQARGFDFVVPANCPAEWLELGGSASDMPQQSDLVISDLSLVRSAAR